MDFVGKRFGKLTVVEYAEKKEGMHCWKCLCDCGNETIVGQIEEILNTFTNEERIEIQEISAYQTAISEWEILYGDYLAQLNYLTVQIEKRNKLLTWIAIGISSIVIILFVGLFIKRKRA